MRGNKHSSGVFDRPNPNFTGQSASGLRKAFTEFKTRPGPTVFRVLAASIYFATIGLSWGAEPEVTVNIDASLQKLALHARQTMPEAQVAGVHAQIVKVSAVDKAQIPGRWDANDRVLTGPAI